MVGRRQDNELSRLYYGNILYYDYLSSHRNPTFLRRNLRRVLQLHEEELEKARTRSIVSTVGLEHRDRLDWKMPASKTVRAELAKQSFHLLIKTLKPIHKDGSLEGLNRRPSKKKGPLFRCSIHLHVMIWDPQSGQPCKMFNDRNASIVGIQTLQGKAVSINTNEFSIRPDELRLPMTADEAVYSRRNGMAETYELKFSINFQSSLDAEEVLMLMGSESVQSRKDGSSRWVATCEDILQCPDDGKLLPLSYVAFDGDKKSFKRLPLGLEISTRYTTHPGESVLAASNLRLRSRYNTHSLVVQEPTKPRLKIEISYVYLDETLTFSELKCPHCLQRLNYQDLDELHMHLKFSHDLFEYHARKVKEVDGIQYWTFECEVADHKADQRASDRTPDPREVQILAPSRPFNRREYLDEGNEDWQMEARLERPSARSAKQSFQRELPLTSRNKSKPPDKILPRPNRERRQFSVPKAPPGVTFLRVFTKRPLTEGEYISESEDDVDMDWLQLRTDSLLISNPSIPDQAKTFLKEFNRYIRRERLQDDVHLGDALIRFTQEKKEWISQENLEDEFKKKIQELLDDEIISRKVSNNCLRILGVLSDQHSPQRRSERRRQLEELKGHPHHPTPPQTPLSVTPDVIGNETAMSNGTADRARASELIHRLKYPNNSRPDRGKTRVTDLGQTTPQTIDLDGDVEMADLSGETPSDPALVPPYDKCICGKGAFLHGKRAIVHCESVYCVRRTFHVDCVTENWKLTKKLDPRQTDWYCRECEQNPRIGTGEKKWYES